jgi:tetratricopeptide (TPR) repeat protein
MFLAALLMLPLPLPVQADAAAQARLEKCVDLATADPRAGEAEAARWRTQGGGFLARQCLGIAYAHQEKWGTAAAAFEEAAREAETVKDSRSPNYWAQAGNAWLAAGDAGKARAAIDAALAAGSLSGLDLGEAHLDRARARVASDDLAGARSDLDRAIVDAKDDPLAWLLSATLARKMGELPRARTDIAEALRRSPDDPSVQLEAGNIAGMSGDEAGARAAFARVVELAPGSPQAESARSALAQFGAEH